MFSKGIAERKVRVKEAQRGTTRHNEALGGTRRHLEFVVCSIVN